MPKCPLGVPCCSEALTPPTQAEEEQTAPDTFRGQQDMAEGPKMLPQGRLKTGLLCQLVVACGPTSGQRAPSPAPPCRLPALSSESQSQGLDLSSALPSSARRQMFP